MSQVNVKTLLDRLHGLRKRSVQEKDALFWADFLAVVVPLCLAKQGHIFKLSGLADKPWVLEDIQERDSLNQPVPLLSVEQMQLPWLAELLQRSLQNGFALHKEDSALSEVHWLGFRLATTEPSVLLFTVPKEHSGRLSEIVMRTQLLVDVPAGSEPNLKDSSEGLKQLLAVIPEVYQANRFNLASYALVNALVSHSKEIDQAVFGVKKGEYIRIETLSHFDKFEKKTELAKLYEAALEETADQQTTLHLRSPNQTSCILLAHRQLQQALGCADLMSFALYDDEGEVYASILLVSMNQPFSAELVNATSFILELLSPRLYQLKMAQMGGWYRIQKGVKHFFAMLFGKQWLWTKFITFVVFILMLWLLLGSLSLRLEAKAQFETDQTVLIAAPQDGFIVKVEATAGDEVKQNQLLMVMKTQDLLLQMTELLAEKHRYEVEEDKARAVQNLVDAEIAKARHAQVAAKIARLELKLDEANIVAPFDAVLVEGERKNLLGVPVKQGDSLMKLAKIEGLYLVMLVDERDIHLVTLGDTGEFALVSQPLEPMPFVVEQIIPAAQDGGSAGAQFKVKAKLLNSAEKWWRPGMTGVAKIDKGDAPVYWVLGRKTYHQLRLMLWW